MIQKKKIKSHLLITSHDSIAYIKACRNQEKLSIAVIMLRLLLTLALVATTFSIPTDSNVEKAGRIVGGQDAALGQFPYQASLRNRETGVHFYGSFIINNHWVGTSFRCTFWRQPASNILVIVGATRLSSSGTAHQAIEIVGHPEYRVEGFGTYENDISLVRIENSLTFSATVAPIALGTIYVGGGVNGILAG